MDFTTKLLRWYKINKRDLPWRRTKDPYLVWLSEVIMQQTRIEQGLPYYIRFSEMFPALSDLAAADEQEVLKLWQGLGYYSRARNLHATARFIADKYNGVFPSAYEEIRNLRGVGDYTAAAIASICFDLPHAVMDGNVIRFISRHFGIEESTSLPATRVKIQTVVEKYLDTDNPGDYNQAMMEYGARVCTPVHPACASCCFNPSCFAFLNNKVDELPFKKQKPVLHERYFHYLVVTYTDDGTEYICLRKRSGKDIWKNLFDFPCIERSDDLGKLPLQEADFREIMGDVPGRFTEISGPVKHVLTHQKLHVRFYLFNAPVRPQLPYHHVPLGLVTGFPVPKLIERYIAGMSAKT
jgi:A/G-specific adenine glycosylase